MVTSSSMWPDAISVQIRDAGVAPALPSVWANRSRSAAPSAAITTVI